MSDDGEEEITATEAVNLLDVRTWAIATRGNVSPAPGSGMVVANVLPLDDLEAEVLAIREAAEIALDSILEARRRT